MEITKYGETIDLSTERHTACPVCRKDGGGDKSGDNLYVYGLDENGKHRGCRCFACGWSFPNQEWLEENQEYNWEENKVMGLDFNKSVLADIKKEYKFIEEKYRGIRPDIYKYFGVMHKIERGKPVEQIYPTFRGKEVVGFKRRELPKTFLMPYGDVGADVDFFSQWRWLVPESRREVVICSGEIDMLSAYQMLKDWRASSNSSKGTEYPYTPVVSSTVGELGTVAQARNNYEWLNKFDKIIICPDSDEAGRKAVDKMFGSIPKNKMYVMELPMKDANEMLLAGKSKEFIDAYFRASPYVPVGLKGSSSLIPAIREHALVKKIPLPPFMHRVQKMMAGGIPLGVIVNLISSSGSGKSTIVDEIVYHWIFNSPYKLGILSLESDSGEYGTKLLSRHVGRKINLIESVDEKIKFLDSEFVSQKEKELLIDEHGQDRFILLDDRDGNVETIKDSVEKMVVQMGCKVIVCDPLQDIIACLPDDEQNKFMSWQKGLLKSHGVTFFNVNHTKKALTGGGAGSKGVDLVEEDSHGSSSIYKSAACNLLFGRNKEAENPIVRNTTIMKVSKMRWTGNTSPFAGKYFYDNATHTLHDYDDWIGANPDLASFEDKPDK